ncbi:class I SAM-dependent methyltransferase [Cellulomonas endometrii]|uniref:class I SAM-dependent methyltransferase n=1 Tax=Cellulomonas endometrii TaxID=3036301 RepID=UPI0024AD129D|nr:class I SAM-dependent methyltransferase [Cellulomonas endometrii]
MTDQPASPTRHATHDDQHARRAASFGAAAALYQTARPSYPDEAVAWCVPRSALDVVDLAAGTGKLTERILAQDVPGRRVTAVEPSPGMRDALHAALPGVTVLPGTAEGTGLPAASADAVAVGQAWHWFDPPRAAAELARVLRPGGTLALLWNVRDTEAGAGWVAEVEEILHRDDPLRTISGAPALGPMFGPVEHRQVRWTDPVAPSSLRALAASRSHVLTLPEDAREALLAEIDELAATHPELRGRDVVAMPYRTDCFRAVRTAAR